MQQPTEIDVDEQQQVVARVAAVDVAKVSGMECPPVPHQGIDARRVTKVWQVNANTGSLLELADHLVCQGIERTVLESTSDYWRPFYYVLATRQPAGAGRAGQGPSSSRCADAGPRPHPRRAEPARGCASCYVH